MRERFIDRLRFLIAAMLLVALPGCGTLPPKSTTVVSSRTDAPASTALGRIASVSQPEGWPSGFRLLPQAEHAFEARERSIAHAEISIDAQHYFIAGDASGLSFLQSLEAAARRGVRVRLLVDDLHDAEIDAQLARLSRLSNFEIRLFNPFCCEPALALSGPTAHWDHRDHDDHYAQPGALFRLMTPPEQERLFANTARSMGSTDRAIKERHVANCGKADPAYGRGVERALKLGR